MGVFIVVCTKSEDGATCRLENSLHITIKTDYEFGRKMRNLKFVYKQKEKNRVSTLTTRYTSGTHTGDSFSGINLLTGTEKNRFFNNDVVLIFQLESGSCDAGSLKWLLHVQQQAAIVNHKC